MTKQKSKRLLSLLLSLAMVFSLTVTPVYAADDTSSESETNSTSAATFSEPEAFEEDAVEDTDEGEELVAYAGEEDTNYGIAMIDEDTTTVATVSGTSYSSLSEAFSAASSSSGTVTMAADVILSAGISIDSGSVTLDLAGHSITRNETYSESYLINVASGASLTVTDSGTGGKLSSTYVKSEDGGTYISNYAILTAGTVTVTAGTVRGYRAIYGNAGTVNVNGGTVYGSQIGILADGSVAVNVSDNAVVTGQYAIYGWQETYTGTVTISGGTVGNSSSYYGLSLQCGTAVVSGGTVTGRTGIYSAGTLTVSGTAIVTGSRDAEETWAYGIYLNAGATATISDSAQVIATNTNENGYSAGIVYFGNSDSTTPTKLTITGGTISGESYGLSGNGSASYSEVTISGGSISGAYGIYHPEMGTLTISGGAITGSVTGIEMRSGELIVTGGTITSTYTGTFATENNGSGTTVVGAGIAVSQHTTDKTIEVNISGGTISGIYGVYEINYNTSNTSTVSVKVTEDEDGSSATITTTDSTQGAAVYSTSLDDTSTSTAKNSNTSVELSAGTYNTDVSKYTTTTSSAVATATTDEDGNTVYTVVETVEGAVVVVYDKGGNLTGSYTTLKAAYSAVTDGGIMLLVADVSEEQLGASTNKSVTLDLNGHTISKSSGSVIDCSNGTLTIKDSSQTDSAIGKGMVQGTGNVALKLRGGNVVLESGTLESTAAYVVTMSGGTLTVNGGAVIGASSANCLVYYTGGILTINDGLFTVVDRTSSVTESEVTSGAIVNVGSNTASTASEDDEKTSAEVSIAGGVFQMYRPLLGSGITLEITGGYFLSKYSLSTYYPTGYGYTTVDSYTYLGTTYTNYYQVAQTNFTLAVTSNGTTTESYYKTLVAAVNAAIDAYSDGTEITITMNNDYETGKVPVEKEVAFMLDLNGHTLTSTDKGAFKITDNSATVTIKDSSTDGTGTITTYDANSESLTSSTTALFQVSNGTLNIENGNFNQNAGQALVAGSGTVSITGGYFTSDPSDYLADNYASVKPADETYTYTVLSVALGASSDNTTVYATSIDGYGTNTLYVGVSASNISGYNTENYPTISLTYTSDSSVDSGSYIFAGWYILDEGVSYTACTSDMWSSTLENGTYYAKFVEANVLSVQCMFTYNVSGMGNIWRFFTGINGQDMDGVIFKVTNSNFPHHLVC